MSFQLLCKPLYHAKRWNALRIATTVSSYHASKLAKNVDKLPFFHEAIINHALKESGTQGVVEHVILRCIGNIDIIKRLLQFDRTSITNAKDEDGNSPLHYASKNGHINVLDTLIRNGADVNTKNFNDTTPLHLAAYEGNEKIVEYLLKHSADPTIVDRNGNSVTDVICIDYHGFNKEQVYNNIYRAIQQQTKSYVEEQRVIEEAAVQLGLSIELFHQYSTIIEQEPMVEIFDRYHQLTARNDRALIEGNVEEAIKVAYEIIALNIDINMVSSVPTKEQFIQRIDDLLNILKAYILKLSFNKQYMQVVKCSKPLKEIKAVRERLLTGKDKTDVDEQVKETQDQSTQSNTNNSSIAYSGGFAFPHINKQ